MTGISADHGTRAELHPDGCTCPVDVDMAIIEEDNHAITEHPWIDSRRESAMTRAQRLADEKAEEYNGWLLYIADQYEDMRDWLWSRGVID